jgi:hypothetical protein
MELTNSREEWSVIPITVICTVRMRLSDNYNIAATLYAHCTSELHQKIGSCSKFEYDYLNRIAEDSRNELNMVFDELERHVAQHGCESGAVALRRCAAG